MFGKNTSFWKFRQWSHLLKREGLTLYFAFRHPLTPWYAKIFTAVIVGYLLSPVDLIPDFIPVIGLLDEIVLIPIAVTLALRLLPAPILAECRLRAAATSQKLPRLWLAGLVIILIWLAAIILLVRKIF